MEFHDIVIQQKSYFDSNSTKSIAFRKIMLKKLMDALDEREDLLLEALHKDLGKSRGEGYMTEVGMVRSEIKEALINVEAWSHPKKADGSFLTFFPATNHIYTEPYGVVLIIAPWNYPLNLTLMPLVGAIAAGNCAIVKCSRKVSIRAVPSKIFLRTFSHRNISIVRRQTCPLRPFGRKGTT